ncbi:hypothetical protein NQ314_000961 [Rhamnusium bicolor]|uniref:Defensin-like protein n=1 Tax=Rhamnusium bicolor TaxID=1586634 RepID=A0AAV8ZWK6_9CUCU|nr:hypothetical protein NQ314_000961 [Rhamnusium bicolor]
MKSTLVFALLFSVFVAVLSSENGVGEEGPEGVEQTRVERSVHDCNNEACRASCILNGHHEGSCNSNDNCDCN